MNCPASSAPVLLDPGQSTEQATCATHGEYTVRVFDVIEGMKPIRSPCPDCDAEFREKEDTRRQRQRALQERTRIARLFDRSGIPERFKDRRLDNYRADSNGQARALEIARRFVQSDENGASMIFCGKPGTGKTHLACGIAAEFIESGLTALFHTVLGAIRHVKDTYRKNSERTESGAINDLVQPSLLILDEVGVQVGSEHEKMVLFEIINERYQQCRSTILISNLTHEALGEYLGDRIIDRFREAGAVVAFDWNSYRGTARTSTSTSTSTSARQGDCDAQTYRAAKGGE